MEFGEYMQCRALKKRYRGKPYILFTTYQSVDSSYDPIKHICGKDPVLAFYDEAHCINNKFKSKSWLDVYNCGFKYEAQISLTATPNTEQLREDDPICGKAPCKVVRGKASDALPAFTIDDGIDKNILHDYQFGVFIGKMSNVEDQFGLLQHLVTEEVRQRIMARIGGVPGEDSTIIAANALYDKMRKAPHIWSDWQPTSAGRGCL